MFTEVDCPNFDSTAQEAEWKGVGPRELSTRSAREAEHRKIEIPDAFAGDVGMDRERSPDEGIPVIVAALAAECAAPSAIEDAVLNSRFGDLGIADGAAGVGHRSRVDHRRVTALLAVEAKRVEA